MLSTYLPRRKLAINSVVMPQLFTRPRVALVSKLAFALFWLALFAGTHIPMPPDVLPPSGGDKLAHLWMFGLKIHRQPVIAKRLAGIGAD